MTGIAAVQARIAELQAAFTPTVSTPTVSTSAVSTEPVFAQALSAAQATTTPAASDSTVTGEALVESAKKYQGTPYVWGGESLAEGGLDCSGLVQRALADLGVTDIPRTARQQMTLGQEVPSLDQARPGDLVVFGGGSHIGIYVGDGKMIDAPKPGDQVRIRDVYTEPTTIRRILPSAAEVAGPATASWGVATTAGPATASTAATSTSAGQAALALLAGNVATTGLFSGATPPTTDLSALWGVTA